MSRLFTALEEICPPSSARRAVLFYWLSLERQRNSSTFWVLELRPFHARKGNCVRANSQNICLLFIVMYCVSWFSQSCLKSLFPQTVCWLLRTGLSIECLLCPLSHGELWQWNRWVRRVTWFRGSHDFCGFLQISAMFIEPCWSTLSKTRSNPHIHMWDFSINIRTHSTCFDREQEPPQETWCNFYMAPLCVFFVVF